MKRLVFATIVVAFSASSVGATQIERACMRADRKAASRALCGCIQDVADLTLSQSEQKLAASFFNDPQKAQDLRQSSNPRNERFWQRYKDFGANAGQFCASAS